MRLCAVHLDIHILNIKCLCACVCVCVCKRTPYTGVAVSCPPVRGLHAREARISPRSNGEIATIKGLGTQTAPRRLAGDVGPKSTGHG